MGGALSPTTITIWLYTEASSQLVSIITIKSKLYKVLLSAVLAFLLLLFKTHQSINFALEAAEGISAFS